MCKCDCGNQIIVRGSSLRKGITTSCGCIHKEIVANIGKKNKKYNKYILGDRFGTGYTRNNYEFYFDLEDYDKIKDYCWHSRDGYLVSEKSHNEVIIMHRLIMNCPEDKYIDHINHDRRDNRKENLRICTKYENSLNMKKQNRVLSSKYKGVCFDKKSNKWRATITYQGKQKYLGTFKNEEDAALKYNEYAKQFFGEYASLNII